jgi:NAD(P)-dependent dehydrogenase (short-subunit alcohol dehydrogenase family)
MPKSEEDFCPVKTTVRIVGGRWKATVLEQLFQGPKRFSELKRAHPRNHTPHAFSPAARIADRRYHRAHRLSRHAPSRRLFRHASRQDPPPASRSHVSVGKIPFGRNGYEKAPRLGTSVGLIANLLARAAPLPHHWSRGVASLFALRPRQNRKPSGGRTASNMSRVLITGSADGLGKMAAQLLIRQGHSVVLHARNSERTREALAAVPGAETAVTGDLSSISETRAVAMQVNRLGRFDAVIHNAAVGYRERKRIETRDGLPQLFAINTLAPYILTALIERPKRLIYVSSGMHRDVDTSLKDMLWQKRKWQASEAYAETKFHDVLLAFAVARQWPTVLSNSLEPGWVPTKMGGREAPDDLHEGYVTQVWLAVSDDRDALVSGEYFYHQKRTAPSAATRVVATQERLLSECERISGIRLAR